MWWPLDGAFGEVSRAHDEARDADAAGRGLDGVGADADGVRCEVWEVGRDPWQVLSVAGVLPRLREGEGVGERIVKIAGGDHFLIGLTEGGHVLKVDMRAGEEGFSHALHRPRWEYVRRSLVHLCFTSRSRRGVARIVQRGGACADASHV